MFIYNEKFALVTGASKGLGKAYAEELARRGANLVLVARSGALLNELADRLRATNNTRVEVIQADLAETAAPFSLLRELQRRDIDVDLLVNNVGIGAVGQFLKQPLEQQLLTVQVNISGVVALTHLIGKTMVARRTGGIINVASNGAFQPMPYQATYAATKSFLLMFSEALAEEVSGTGVGVMVACPGPTATQFFDGSTIILPPKTMDAPEDIARQTLDDFTRGKVVSYPGRRSTWINTLASRFLPRTTVTKIAGRITRKAGFNV